MDAASFIPRYAELRKRSQSQKKKNEQTADSRQTDRQELKLTLCPRANNFSVIFDFFATLYERCFHLALRARLTTPKRGRHQHETPGDWFWFRGDAHNSKIYGIDPHAVCWIRRVGHAEQGYMVVYGVDCVCVWRDPMTRTYYIYI